MQDSELLHDEFLGVSFVMGWSVSVINSKRHAVSYTCLVARIEEISGFMCLPRRTHHSSSSRIESSMQLGWKDRTLSDLDCCIKINSGILTRDRECLNLLRGFLIIFLVVHICLVHTFLAVANDTNGWQELYKKIYLSNLV